MHFKIGMPLGFYPSQWLANYILSPIDFMIVRSRPKAYIRYVDDMIICDNSKRRLRDIFYKIKRELGKLRLKVKSNYQIVRFYYHGSGRPIDIMGFKFYRYTTILRKRILNGIIRLVNRISCRSLISISQARSLLSRFGWFKHSDTKQFFNKDIKPKVSIVVLKDLVRKAA